MAAGQFLQQGEEDGEEQVEAGEGDFGGDEVSPTPGDQGGNGASREETDGDHQKRQNKKQVVDGEIEQQPGVTGIGFDQIGEDRQVALAGADTLQEGHARSGQDAAQERPAP